MKSPRLRLESALERPDLAALDPVERAETLSLLLIELQRRIGLELLPLLDASSERHFRMLMERDAGSDELAAFLSVRIPDYRDRVESVTEKFCEECQTSLDGLSASGL